MSREAPLISLSRTSASTWKAGACNPVRYRPRSLEVYLLNWKAFERAGIPADSPCRGINPAHGKQMESFASRLEGVGRPAGVVGRGVRKGLILRSVQDRAEAVCHEGGKTTYWEGGIKWDLFLSFSSHTSRGSLLLELSQKGFASLRRSSLSVRQKINSPSQLWKGAYKVVVCEEYRLSYRQSVCNISRFNCWYNVWYLSLSINRSYKFALSVTKCLLGYNYVG